MFQIVVASSFLAGVSSRLYPVAAIKQYVADAAKNAARSMLASMLKNFVVQLTGKTIFNFIEANSFEKFSDAKAANKISHLDASTTQFFKIYTFSQPQSVIFV